MQSINIELRNYGVEFALWDRTHIQSYTRPHEIKAVLDKDAVNWMSPDSVMPWREKSNAGRACGLVFDSNLDITVKGSDGAVLDHFKGSDCFDLTYTYKEYSIAHMRAWAHQRYGGRITGMEISKEGYHCCEMVLPYSVPYSRDKIHFGLSKITNINTYDEAGWISRGASAFVLDSYFVPLYRPAPKFVAPVNANTKVFSLKGPTYQRVFTCEYSFSPPTTYKEANQKECDSFYKHFIRKGEFK
jgi:hypothetical protein